ncbi:protein of unknown function [Tangfeifania diversioriginum]|uniref:DUF4185 domain-containing protein n=1 Tax=Tangfeifania diversioriginum TaxID=1168035 RepID=A0A1M6MY56_9BACT|nr:DUF4185 domain-containing protein [Tangfeifania diversioriginum]SHJ88368.1 protein of unknown function [Tangfeifania diversioriginum]
MKKIKNIILIALIIISSACQNKKQEKTETKELKVTVDEQFNKLFHRDSEGATGADGSISVPLQDGSSVFMMGDSFLDEVKNNQRDSTTKMINNTFIVVNPEQTDAKTLFKGQYVDPESFVIPENDPGKFYWPGHGFVRDSVFHFFMSRFWIPGTGMWGFEFLSTDYFRYSWPEFEKKSVEPFKYTLQNNVHWGHAVLDEDNYIYIYGSCAEEDNICKAHVCRTTLTDDKMLDLKNVQFFDGSTWNSDPVTTEPMKGITSNISEQFSVFKYQDAYVLLSQQRGIGAGEIYTYTSENSYGPWKNKQMIYRTKEFEKDSDIITYNAMAHPQYIKNGELLISYNVNSLKTSRVFENVNYYRPVFLRVPMKMIVEESDGLKTKMKAE